MILKFHSPVVFVKEIEKAKTFYTAILEQEIEHDFGVNIMFKSRLSLWQISNQHEIAAIAGNPEQGRTFELYFESDSIEEIAQRIKASEARLLHDIKTESWGQKTIRFFDPDGHLIEIGETFEVFIQRIYNETKSVRETSKKTGVPEETITVIIREYQK